MARDGASLGEMASAVERSIATVRYWLAQWGIERPRRFGIRQAVDPQTAPRSVVMACRTHGDVEFVLEGRGAYRCRTCRSEQVTRARRKNKALVVDEAGGACVVCGYCACQAALQFHHLDPETKEFGLSHRGLARARTRVRAEAAKCVLLCANCHAEVEAGYRVLEIQ